ncbi:MAG: uncharacterized protein QG608_1754 [Actinomycetota bacterium]|nr:uncharacterized protein [Actinomycetota bacterium]
MFARCAILANMSGSGESTSQFTDGGLMKARLGEEPFDPEGITWTRVSPQLATLRRTVSLGADLVILVVLALLLVFLTDDPLSFGGSAVVPFGIALVIVLIEIWYLWIVGRQTAAWGYAEREDDLLVRHGVMWRTIVVVPYGRMQYVDVSAGPVERSFGLATVRLHTASASTDASIPGLPPQEAARLRDRLSSRGESRLAGL